MDHYASRHDTVYGEKAFTDTKYGYVYVLKEMVLKVYLKNHKKSHKLFSPRLPHFRNVLWATPNF